MCATSLNKPSSQEGLKLVERLREVATIETGLLYSRRTMLEEAAALISEQQAEVDHLKLECQHACQEIEVAIHERDEARSALSRHPSFNDAIEAAAKIAEGTAPIARGNFFEARRKQTAKIASAIRSLKLPDYRGGEAKTAESKHSPSTREG